MTKTLDLAYNPKHGSPRRPANFQIPADPPLPPAREPARAPAKTSTKPTSQRPT